MDTISFDCRVCDPTAPDPNCAQCNGAGREILPVSNLSMTVVPILRKPTLDEQFDADVMKERP